MMDVKITIIGAGIVGLAIARRLSKTTEDVFIIEKNNDFGQESSSRNSEVIHSGIYYPEGSLKSQLCVSGNRMLYEYCSINDIAFNKCGKLIISSSGNDELKLRSILESARKNGVKDGRIIDKDEIGLLEPYINASSAIYFPSSGIVDSHSLMKQFETDALNNQCQTVYGSEVIAIKKLKKGFELQLKENDGSSYSFTSEIVINSAGLSADKLAAMPGINNNKYKIYYWKGEYFGLANGKHKYISSLVYPLPEQNNVGLGIHTTIDLAGMVRLGPNALFLKDNKIDYSVDPDHSRLFYESARDFLPFLEYKDLYPELAGIRPKLQKPGDAVRDFIIREESDSGYPGMINLVGIESPGLTACLSIAEYVSSLIP